MGKSGLGMAAVLAVTIAGTARAQLPSVPPLPQLPPAPSLPAVPQLPSVPALPAPQLPAAPSLPAVPQLPAAPSQPAPAPGPSVPQPAPAAPAAAPAPASSAAPSRPAARQAPAAAPAARAGRAAAPSAAISPHTTTGGERPAPHRGRTRSERRSDRRVQRAVARFGACLQQLPPRQRRVLRLRAGVGPREPATRAAVARRLDLPVARVRLAERRGLRALRRSARKGCGAVSDGSGADPGLSIAGGRAAATAVLATGSGGEDGGSATGGSGRDSGDDSAGGSSGENGGGTGGVKGIGATSPLPVPVATDVGLPLLALLLAALGGLGAWAVRRSRQG